MSEMPERIEMLHLLGHICGSNFHRMQEKLDNLGLYRGQPPVLINLWENEGMTQSELAEKMHRSPSTITKTVQRMEKAGFVERRADPEDERISRVYLTEAGYNVRSAVEAVWQTLAEQAFGSFDNEEMMQFHTFLQRLYDNITRE